MNENIFNYLKIQNYEDLNHLTSNITDLGDGIFEHNFLIARIMLLMKLNRITPAKKYVEDLNLLMNKCLDLEVKRKKPTNFLWPVMSIVNSTIMKSNCHEMNQEWLEKLTQRPFDKKSAVKILIITSIWQRPELTKIFFNHYRLLANNLAQSANISLDLLAVGSEGLDTQKVVTDLDFKYIESTNSPLSTKWDAAIKKSQELDFDAVVILGSDDFLNEKSFYYYRDLIIDGVHYAGFRDIYIFDLNLKKMIRWKGYGESGTVQPRRLGETVGAGRYISRSLLQALDFSLWQNLKIEKSLDGAAHNRITNMLGFLPVRGIDSLSINSSNTITKIGCVVADMSECDSFCVDVKHLSNITTFDRYTTDNKSFSKDLEIENTLLDQLPERTVGELLCLMNKK